MTPAIASDQQTVLQAVIEQLIATVAAPFALTPANCFVSLAIPNTPMTPGPVWVQLAPVSGTFDEPCIEASGQHQVPEDTILAVGIFSRAMIDAAGQDIQLLVNKSYGLMQLKQSILKALVDFNPTGTNAELQTGYLLRSNMVPASTEPPVHAPWGEADACRWTLLFHLNFVWDLGSG